jgi:predicted O-linked N-acetylglucosamine transferase (SPINDLY family)
LRRVTTTKVPFLLSGLDPVSWSADGTRLLAEFAQRGIGEDRLILRREIPADDNMKLTVYHEADVGLDAFPWSGHTTSCNSLWMGVPYVTLRWPNHAGRMAASAITHAGFPQWVAENEDQCVQIVRELISDLPKLAELRRTIRQQMTQSTLCDGRQFTLGWEAALRGAWRKWCAVKREQLINEVSAEANRGLR